MQVRSCKTFVLSQLAHGIVVHKAHVIVSREDLFVVRLQAGSRRLLYVYWTMEAESLSLGGLLLRWWSTGSLRQLLSSGTLQHDQENAYSQLRRLPPTPLL